jgi:hypothetical protein
MSFAENQAFLLGQELQENRPFQIYAEDGSIAIDIDGTVTGQEGNSRPVLPGNNYLVSKEDEPGVYEVAEVGSGWVIVDPAISELTEFENYTKIFQPNLTNPRIVQMDTKRASPFLNLIEGFQVWECRVFLDNEGDLLNFLKVNRTYIVKSNRGLQKFRAIQVQDSRIQGMSTTLILEPLEWLTTA